MMTDKPTIVPFDRKPDASHKEHAMATLVGIAKGIEHEGLGEDEHIVVIYHQEDGYSMIVGLTDMSDDSLIAATARVAKDVLAGAYNPETFDEDS